MKSPLNIQDLVDSWDLDATIDPLITKQNGHPVRFRDILETLRYSDSQGFREYVPTRASDQTPSFLDRLVLWLENQGIEPEDRCRLFEFASHLVYFSADDFHALNRTAFTGPITRWVIKQQGLRLDDPNFESSLAHHRDHRTWYCPVTDSMQISEFYHVNNIGGASHRPGFRSLREFKASGEAIAGYMTTAGFDRLVLLEDIVGTGSQTEEAVEWAAQSVRVPVLFVPLIISPDGLNRFKKLESKEWSNRGAGSSLQVEPIMELDETDFIGQATEESNPLFVVIRELAGRIHPHVLGTTRDDRKVSPYSPMGFHRPKDTATGATVVTYTNCPNNTIPIVHHQSRKTAWRPLFPRVEREPEA